MQRSISIVLLPLFLYLLFCIGLVFYCYSDIRNSELSKFPGFFNSVMAPKAVSRGTKRMLGYGDVEGHDHQEKIQQTCSTQNSVGTITESDGNEFVRSDQGDQRGGKQYLMYKLLEHQTVCVNMTDKILL